jgi:ADP-ribose pyrophosphatase YjhB (NUDIX family)
MKTTHYHPKKNDKGIVVAINFPSAPTSTETWLNLDATATCLPEGQLPTTLNAVEMAPVSLARADLHRLAYGRQFDEPEYHCPKGVEPAAGAVVVEPDGRVWLVHPTNGFGGNARTYPKGKTFGQPLRETAVREAHEESGLLVELTGFLADSKRTTTYTRYYLARRVGGTPSDMGWESQAVSLAPFDALEDLLNSPLDQAVMAALGKQRDEWRNWFKDEDWFSKHGKRILLDDNQYGLTSAHRILYTIDAFRARYGTWPTRVSMDTGMYEAIPREVLSPYGWQCLKDQVFIDAAAIGTVVAFDDAGHVFDYADFDSSHLPPPGADVWIWGLPLA